MQGYTLVFDLDGTLVDTAPDLSAATNHALMGLGLGPVPEAELRPWVSYGARRMIVEALAWHRSPREAPVVDALLETFLGHYEANIARMSRPFPGAVAALARFRSAGALLAICTNKREALSRALIAELGLAGYFHALAGRDTFPVSKPDPGHLTGAISLAGGDPRRAVMIGDSAVDIAAAKGAGVPSVACSFGYSSSPAAELGASAIIDHFSDLERVLASLGIAAAA